jgi:hypothetical protein
MPQYLKPRVFAGAATIFLAVVNLLKIPPYFLLGHFSRENLSVSRPHPVAVLSTLAGVWPGATGVRRPVPRHHPRAHLPHRGQIDL